MMTPDDTDGAPLQAGDPRVVVGVFEDLPIMVVALVGPELRIDAANRAYREFFGRPDVVGQDRA